MGTTLAAREVLARAMGAKTWTRSGKENARRRENARGMRPSAVGEEVPRIIFVTSG